MIITAGKYKGKKIKAPKGEMTRPTSSKVRQAFMNICQLWVNESSFLDLFAGSGSMGLEAISRGATSAVFVENDSKAVSCIKENIADLSDRADRQDFVKPLVQIVQADVKKCARSLKSSKKVTIAWADPPYSDAANIAERLFEVVSGVADIDCLFGIEHSREYPDSSLALAEAAAKTGWVSYKDKSYGSTLLSVWKYQGEV